MTGITAIFYVPEAVFAVSMIRLAKEVVCDPEHDEVVLLPGTSSEQIYAALLLGGEQARCRLGVIASAQDVAHAAERMWEESRVRVCAVPLLRVWAPDETELARAEAILGPPLDMF
jgi:hypothetical protein